MSKSYEVHSFECSDEMHLFLWVNGVGIKFAAYYGLTYAEAKRMFSERITPEFMSTPPGRISGVIGLNKSIIKSLGVFTTCPA